MPAELTYPGVYIQEVPSGVRTITGVATSITAFVGRAAAGPPDEAVMLTSFDDYERRFGGLAADCPMSYAVRDFYANGGSRALVVRVTREAKEGEGTNVALAQAATISLPLDDNSNSPSELILKASSVGAWGNKLSARVDYEHLPPVQQGQPQEFFNLTLRWQPQPDGDGVIERFSAVSRRQDNPRYLPIVLQRESRLMRVMSGMPATTVPKQTPPDPDAAANSGADGDDIDEADIKRGLAKLHKVDLFNLLCIPPLKRTLPVSADGNSTYILPTQDAYTEALNLCHERRAVLIVDPDPAWASQPVGSADKAITGKNLLGFTGPDARNAALYFPCVRMPDPLDKGRPDTFVPCGIVAGIMARTDAQRGVWKAPAGLDASLNGTLELQVRLNDLENGELNPQGINCLRDFGPNGRVVWGARTLRGSDAMADEYKYLPVRRLTLFLEESLYRGTQWVVFEPNDEPLWAQVRLNVGAFMQRLFRQGAFQGRSAREAYFVRCDAQTTTQADIDLGILNVMVGFAPLKPAEFVVIHIQQMAGQIPT